MAALAANPEFTPSHVIDETKRLDNLLRGLTEDGLEELTYRVVKLRYQNAEWLRAPYDYGLDVIAEAAANDGRAKGWQAKNVGDRIYWEQYDEGIDRAVGHWDPATITFVFPRRLTTSERDKWRAFRDEALSRHDSLGELLLCEDLAVVIQGHPDIVNVLDDGSLGRYTREITRATAYGANRVTNADDMLGIAVDQAKAEADGDAFFDYEVARRKRRAAASPGGREFSFSVDLDVATRLPVLKLTLNDGDFEATVAAIPRDGAGDNRVRPWFAPTPEGRAAREKARSSLALGVPTTLRGQHVGVVVERVPDRFVDRLDDKDGILRSGELRLDMSDPIELMLTLTDADSKQQSLSFDMYRVPPDDGYDFAFAGMSLGIMTTLDIRRTDHDKVRSVLSQQVMPAAVSSTELLQGLRFGAGFSRAEAIVIESSELLPDGPIEDRGPVPDPTNEETIRLAIYLAEVASRIEQRNDKPFPLPNGFTSADLMTAELVEGALAGGAEVELDPSELVMLPSDAPTDLTEYDPSVPSVTTELQLFGRPTGVVVQQQLHGAHLVEILRKDDLVAAKIEATGDAPPRLVLRVIEEA